MAEVEVHAGPVPVNITNWPAPEPVRVIKSSSLKTYLLDPSGVSGPKSVQIAGLEPLRRRVLIEVFDNPLTILTDSPVVSPDNAGNVSGSGFAVPQGRLILPALNMVREVWGSDPLWLNTVVTPSNQPVTSGVVDTTTGTFAAAAAGSLFGPAAGESVAGFSVYFQNPAAAVQADITLTNVLGGTQTWRIVVPTGGLNFTPPIPYPIPAANSGVFPTVNVPAIVGGPAYSIFLQSLKTTQFSRVTVTKEYHN